jgi:hypothetical protein
MLQGLERVRWPAVSSEREGRACGEVALLPPRASGTGHDEVLRWRNGSIQ